MKYNILQVDISLYPRNTHGITDIIPESYLVNQIGIIIIMEVIGLNDKMT